MDILQQCAKNYIALTHQQYRIIIGRKQQRHEIVLHFHPANFHHLAGLHKLTDVSQFQDKRREDVLKKSSQERIQTPTLTRAGILAKSKAASAS